MERERARDDISCPIGFSFIHAGHGDPGGASWGDPAAIDEVYLANPQQPPDLDSLGEGDETPELTTIRTRPVERYAATRRRVTSSYVTSGEARPCGGRERERPRSVPPGLANSEFPVRSEPPRLVYGEMRRIGERQESLTSPLSAKTGRATDTKSSG